MGRSQSFSPPPTAKRQGIEDPSTFPTPHHQPLRPPTNPATVTCTAGQGHTNPNLYSSCSRHPHLESIISRSFQSPQPYAKPRAPHRSEELKAGQARKGLRWSFFFRCRDLFVSRGTGVGGTLECSEGPSSGRDTLEILGSFAPI